MKYTARHIQKFIEQGKIDPMLWKNHFPSLLPTQVPTCADCEDFKGRSCLGDREPVECFLAAQLEAENQPRAEEEKKRKKVRDPMLGIGPKGRAIPGGANKSRDQSKM